MQQEGRVGQVSGTDLDEGHSQIPDQKIRARRVKRRRNERNAPVPAIGGKLEMSVVREFELPHHLELVLIGVGDRLLIVRLLRTIGEYGRAPEGLKLDEIRPRVRSRIDKFPGEVVEGPVMVDAGFLL